MQIRYFINSITLVESSNHNFAFSSIISAATFKITCLTVSQQNYQAQLLPKQIFVGKFTPSSIAFTDLDFWTWQLSAKGAHGPQIASFLSCQCLNEGLRKELLSRRSSMFSNIFPEKRFSCIIHIVIRDWKKQ